MHYPWHPKCGIDVEVQYREARRGESVCVCRVDDDTSEVIPAWMFDPSACGAMQLGARQASLEALEHVRVILHELGFDRAAAATHARPWGAAKRRQPEATSYVTSGGGKAASLRGSPQQLHITRCCT